MRALFFVYSSSQGLLFPGGYVNAYRFIVKGLVQGVFFRATTASKAQELGVAGSATNLADGSVEVIAFGDEASIQELERWLRAGPRQARVDSVSKETFAGNPPEGFSIR